MIDKDIFEKQNFLSHGVVEQIDNIGIGRVPGDWKPSNSIDAEFREKIRDIMWEKADEYRAKTGEKIGDYYFIEKYCRIPEDTMKKAINGKYRITRNFIAKFTVGLKLDIEAANSIFKDHSGELNLTNDFDYIVYHALKTKDQIDDFIIELNDLIGINLDQTR